MTTDSFRFVGYPVRVHAGPDAISKLAEEIDRVRAKHVLVVCGQSIINKTDLVGRVKDALGERVAGVFSGGKTGSPVTSVLEGVAVARDVAADGIVAVGGGSAVVTARGITILLAENGTAQSEAESKQQAESLYPLILIVAYLLGAVCLIAWASHEWAAEILMRHFMAGFFLMFSFFKLLELRGERFRFGNRGVGK